MIWASSWCDLKLAVRLVVVLGREVDLPHALLEEVDEEEVEAGHNAHHKEETEEWAGSQLKHLVVQTLDEKVGEGDLHLRHISHKFAGNSWKFGGNLNNFWRDIEVILRVISAIVEFF